MGRENPDRRGQEERGLGDLVLPEDKDGMDRFGREEMAINHRLGSQVGRGRGS